ncbi:Lanosterol 14-alpha-demethylase [Blyttiomyces sp. JEL0837]|nr:Lanosterol 14-alpha-demethylase [Blyttiomyces sp. JEL0837]
MGLFETLQGHIVASAQANPVLTALVAVVIMAIVSSLVRSSSSAKSKKNMPPHVPYNLPFIGSTVPYGVQPVEFLQLQQQKIGDCFTFLMLGRKMTFCLGPDGNHFVFNVKLKNATAEGAYDKLTVPVFGKEVVYDVENSIFMEQKKFVKDALTTTAFKKYVPIIAEESHAFFDSIVFPDGCDEVVFETFAEMSELTIRTASHCLMGKEIRQQLREGVVSKLYHDLDRGLAPINVFFEWLPLPTYFNRDRAHNEMTTLFTRIIKERRANNDFENTDVLQALMSAEYKDGSRMSDSAVAHMMIAMLMAGQHTSSTTSSWILFELARRPDVVAELIKEQSMVLTGKPDTPIHLLPALDYEAIRKLTFMDCVMKESLRLHAPIHTIMRKVEEDVEYKGYTIPKGHFLCAAPQVSHLDSTRFPDPHAFDPWRHMNSDEEQSEWTINGVDIAQKSARSHFLPFGAGRHRCIGEAFAYIQNKTIASLFIRDFEVSLPKDPKTGQPMFPETDFTSLIVVPKAGSKMIVKKRVVKA